MRSQRCLTRSSSLHSKSYLYGIAFSRPACLFYLGAVIDPLHGKKINRIVGCAWNVDALIVRNFREKHWENILQRGNTIHRRESCRREKVAIVENSSKKRFFKCRPNRVACRIWSFKSCPRVRTPCTNSEPTFEAPDPAGVVVTKHSSSHPFEIWDF